MPKRIRDERHKETLRLWYIKNREKVLAKSKSTEHKNRRKELRKLPNNIISKNATEARRRSLKQQATPSWVTKDHYAQIKLLYWLAKDLEAVSGEQYHVDHIVPLRNKKVCGLHVPWNLQVLPADINISKGNKYSN